jgi:integrase/recombinase XerD
VKLTDLITQYAAFRKSMGEDFRSNEKALRCFSRAVGEQLDLTDLTVDIVTRFLNGTGPITINWSKKRQALRGLFRYAVSRSYLSTAPLPKTTPKLPPSLVPYIYSRDELRRLIDGAASGAYRVRRRLLEPYTFRAVLLLLYGAGLRVSEALSLKLANVDLQDAMVVIRDTKFYKSRLVPLGAELNQAMVEYARERSRNGHSQDPEAFLFVTKKGGRIPIRTLQHAFRHLRSRTGIGRTDGAVYQPRLHDLRHAFAVHRLTTWYHDNKDVQRLLPLLSTYLGHLSIAATQIYLTMTPELLQEAGLRFAKYAFEEASHE